MEQSSLKFTFWRLPSCYSCLKYQHNFLKVAAPSPGQYGGATYYGGPGAQPGNAPVPGYPTGYPNYGGQSGPD